MMFEGRFLLAWQLLMRQLVLPFQYLLVHDRSTNQAYIPWCFARDDSTQEQNLS